MGTVGQVAAGASVVIERALPQCVIRDVVFGAENATAQLQLQIELTSGSNTGTVQNLVQADVGGIIGVPYGLAGPLRLQLAANVGQQLRVTWTNIDPLYGHRGWIWFVIDT